MTFKTMKKKTTRKQTSNKKKRSPKNGKKKHNRQSREHLLNKTVLTFMKNHPNEAFSCKEVASMTGLWSKNSNQKIRAVMDGLAGEGKVAYKGRGKYQYLSTPKVTIGKLEVTRGGFGFVLRDTEDDIFIGPQAMGKALHGDLVKVKLLKIRKKEAKPEGEIIEVIQRARTEFVGTVEAGYGDSYFLLPDDPKVKTDFYIAKGKLNKAKPGQKVLAKMTKWELKSPEVEVITVLGKAGEHHTEMHAILLQYGFDPKFPDWVEKEAESIPETISKAEIKKRRDFRSVTTFTIDPSDAKDFDDALSFRKLENGRYEVGIHIADVSHYVKPDSALDKEAFQRATSVYLVDRTVPMLPEKLSNKVCSLRPKEDKLTYSAVFEMDDEAKVHNYWIGRTIIHSDHRFDYDQAQEVIEGKSDGPFAEEMLKLHQLAGILRKKRLGSGSIEFESNEVKFELDENGKPLRVIKKTMKDSNHLIEDFMLLANRTVAKHIHGLMSNPPLPSVYRIHDRPDPEKLANLQQFVKGFGFSVDFETKGDLSGRLNGLLHKVHGSPVQNVIETIAVRSMAKAIYSINNIGHFGLGFPFYTHFTSPIRRYPDLMIHRLLTAYHNKQYRENPVVLEEQCRHCSEKERTAADAERASIKYKQVEFLEGKIGEEFKGIISGVIESGFFVELEDNMCEGFVPARTMENDYYVYDEAAYALIGKDTGEVFRLGDSVLIEIMGTDLGRRTIDMELVEHLGEKAKSAIG